MVREIRWSETAKKDLRKIKAWISKDSHINAERVTREILEKVKMIAESPNLGGSAPGYKNQTVRRVLVHKYKIIFRVFKDRIDIAHIKHGARNFPKQ